jgi:hypothetical protein
LNATRFATAPAGKVVTEANRVRGTFARGGSSAPYGNLQEDAMSDQTDLIRGTLDC